MSDHHFPLTHEYQGRVQVLVMFLHELLVVFLGFLTVVVVERSAEILSGLTNIRGSTEGGHE